MSGATEVLFSCILFSLILSICAQHLSVPSDLKEICGISHDSDRIVGGKNAALGQFPWQARIGFKLNSRDLANGNEPAAGRRELFNCGGALISRRHVLTAAHCQFPEKKNDTLVMTSIHLGELITNTDLDCDDHECSDEVQIFRPAEIRFLKTYTGPPKHKPDICVVKLDRDVKITDWVRPICLPYGKMMTEDFMNRTAVVSGWGITSSLTLIIPKVLQHVSVPIVPMDSCEATYGKHDLDATEICAGLSDGIDACNGDSGGPLQIVEDTAYGPRYFLIGIVSYGTDICGSSPSVYARVTASMNMILEHMFP